MGMKIGLFCFVSLREWVRPCKMSKVCIIISLIGLQYVEIFRFYNLPVARLKLDIIDEWGLLEIGI